MKLTSNWETKYEVVRGPEPTAVIHIGSWHISLYDKTFTEEQIKNMKELLGWEVENLCESQSET